MDDEVGGDDKSVEELIRELRQINAVFRELDMSNMPEHTRGFVQGVLMSLRLATHPPTPEGVQLLSMVATAYKRKYGLEPEDEARTAEAVKQGQVVWEELQKQPDREERLKAREKYKRWPSEVID